MKTKIKIFVNKESTDIYVEPMTTLVDVIRNELKLTGAHVGCDTASCGACTILLENKAVKSCSLLAKQCDGMSIETIESLAKEDLHPLQKKLSEFHGLQCGFCTPGFIMTGLQLVKDNIPLTREEIKDRLKGNLCRCTGYIPIIEAFYHILNKKD